jgi:hypothetical protein
MTIFLWLQNRRKNMKKFKIIKENRELVGEGEIKETEPDEFQVDLICEGSDAHFYGEASEKDAVDRVMRHLYEVFSQPRGESYSIQI